MENKLPVPHHGQQGSRSVGAELGHTHPQEFWLKLRLPGHTPEALSQWVWDGGMRIGITCRSLATLMSLVQGQHVENYCSACSVKCLASFPNLHLLVNCAGHLSDPQFLMLVSVQVFALTVPSAYISSRLDFPLLRWAFLTTPAQGTLRQPPSSIPLPVSFSYHWHGSVWRYAVIILLSSVSPVESKSHTGRHFRWLFGLSVAVEGK